MIKHIGKIFDKEYDINYSNNNDIIILDIGANIGGFARWAKYRWPNSQIWCYEPIKENYKLLVKNTLDIETVHCHNLAVGSKKETRQMYYGINNIGEASFYLGKEQKEEGEKVKVISAETLPKAHIVKIDTEGAEIEILTNIKFLPDVFLIEFHSAENRKIIDKYLDVYTLMECKMRDHNYGVLKYVRTEILNAE
jgi:FkbM family methyltransferase